MYDMIPGIVILQFLMQQTFRTEGEISFKARSTLRKDLVPTQYNP